ncbi:MAG: hypothetical protein LBT89_06250 [Planctomycetaceae bacterium]|jgi:cell fate regulator YaaT (PSP1 superfamily)|nr:hypothetical protein [Planctomycetaceae bacterium]
MRLHGVFSFADTETDDNAVFRHGTRVVVHTPRGQETGTVLCSATQAALDKIKPDIPEDRILRVMTLEDEMESRKILEVEKDDVRRCKGVVDSMELQMTLVRVERLFGGERLVVYYTAENRIDFRELVKMLTGEFHTRIEMRQIGVRDETKLLADFGDCGRDVCCNQFLIEIPPVSMKMAKLQKATFDPNKISGRCGRLKCCLRYEYDQYTGNKKERDGKDDDKVQEI